MIKDLVFIYLILFPLSIESINEDNATNTNNTTLTLSNNSMIFNQTFPQIISNSTFNISALSTSLNINNVTPPAPYKLMLSSTMSSLLNKTIELYEVNETYYSVNFLENKSMFDDWMFDEGFIILRNSVVHSLSLKFAFNFYGHELNSIVVTSTGFFYMSDFLHQYMTFSQYIAPFMVQIQSRQKPKGIIKFKSTANYLQVIWKDMIFQYDSNGNEYRNVTFSAVLMKNGSIVFFYCQVPLRISSTITVGLSDAFYEDFENLNLRRIVLYSKISILKKLFPGLIIMFTPKKICNSLVSCGMCLNAPPEMKCQWCSSLNHCSNGYDRLRQRWLKEKCHLTSAQPSEICSFLSVTVIVTITIISIFVVIFLCILVFCIKKKYNNPTSRIGKFFLENRPSNIRERFSQIKFRRDIPYHVTLQ